jgi:hypothetical protein
MMGFRVWRWPVCALTQRVAFSPLPPSIFPPYGPHVIPEQDQ